MNAFLVIARLVAIFALLGSTFARADVYLTEEQALKLAFPKADGVEKTFAIVESAQRTALAKRLGDKEIPNVFKYWVGRRDGAVKGYALIHDVLGKSQPITYMLALGPDLHVRAVEILAYRETHGGEVRRETWREQFQGKDGTSAVRIGEDIRNIAGATISCRSIADGVRADLACFDVLVGRATPPPIANAVPAAHAVEPASADARTGCVRRARYSMGTTLTITVADADSAHAESAITAAFEEVERLEDILSTFRPESAVSKLNRAAGGDAQDVPLELRDLLARSLALTRATDGAFDVTVGPALNMWREAQRSNSEPLPAAIDAARERIGASSIEIAMDAPRVRLTRAGSEIDFGGIGKGYALDQARAVLEAHGLHAALLDFGGQFLAVGVPPRDPRALDSEASHGWRVEVRDPRAPDGILTALCLTNQSVSTTADYERGLVVGGRRRSHVVDPRTALPVEGMLGAVVVSASGTEADALSTACYVLGAERARELAERRGFAVLTVDASANVNASPSFRALEVPVPVH